jgi:hypothetical protein
MIFCCVGLVSEIFITPVIIGLYVAQQGSNVFSFFSENLIAITVTFVWVIHTSFAIMRLFFDSLCLSFNTLLSALSKTLYNSAVKFPCLDFGAYHINFVSVCCHLQNGVHVVRPLRGQTGGSWRVPGLGCKQDGEIPFLRLLHMRSGWCEAGHCHEGGGHLSMFWLGRTVWMNCCSSFNISMYCS